MIYIFGIENWILGTSKFHKQIYDGILVKCKNAWAFLWIFSFIHHSSSFCHLLPDIVTPVQSASHCSKPTWLWTMLRRLELEAHWIGKSMLITVTLTYV